MQLTEIKQNRKRKNEKRDLCCAWEGLDTDNGVNDDNVFHGYQDAKNKVRQKCSYLDEKNIIVSPHLFAQPRSCISAANDALDAANLRWRVSQFSCIPAKCSANQEVNLTSERPGTPDPSCVPINPSISTDSMTQKQNIALCRSSNQVNNVEGSGTLSMIERIPAMSHVQKTEKKGAWRCTEFVLANHETSSPEPLWKRASNHRLEWFPENLAKVAHLRLSAPANGLHCTRPGVVIRRVARLSGGYRGTQVQGSHAERKLSPLYSHRPVANHKDLQNSYYSLSTSGKWTPNQTVYECLCSPLQPQVRNSPGRDQRDTTQMLDWKKQGQQREFSDSIRMMDIQCQSGCLRNAESPPTPHQVNFSHILQVLQRKPDNFPEVRGHRHQGLFKRH